MTDFNFFLPISKVEKQNDGSVLVHGYASTPNLDLDGEEVSIDAIKKALPGYWEFRNIREMHQPSAVGVGKEYSIDKDGWFLTSRISDPTAVQKCLDQVYKGYSIGGRKLAKKGNVVTELELIEVSIVDRPANPECKLTVAKRAKDGKEAYLLKAKFSRDHKSRALTKMAQAVELISKSGPPAARDGFSRPVEKKGEEAREITPPAFSSSQPSPRDPETQNNKSAGDEGNGHVHDINGETGPPKKPKGNGKGKVPRGNPFANLKGKKKKRAMKLAKQAKAKISTLALSSTESNGAQLTPPALSELDLDSSPNPSPFVDDTGGLGGDGDGTTSSPDLSDLIKSFLSNYEEKNTMDPKAVSLGSVGLDLDTAIVNVIKRGMEPTKAKRMSMAQANLKKARAARKDAAESVKECHASLSKRYMAKVSKAKKPNDDDEDDMAETEKVLKSLQKAYSALTTVKTFIKAADSQISKVARSGQRGQEANDAPGGVPFNNPGVQDLSPSAMATAGGSSTPPMYPGDGSPYPGKLAKYANSQGMVPAHIAELVAENSRLEAQTALLSRTPAGPRPYAFDMAKVYSQDENPAASSQKSNILMAGVNTSDLQSQDENLRNKASATVVGNMLLSGPAFGKSIISPEFRGRAGTGRNSV